MHVCGAMMRLPATKRGGGERWEEIKPALFKSVTFFNGFSEATAGFVFSYGGKQTDVRFPPLFLR